MIIFTSLIIRIVPLMLFIGLGFIAARQLKTSKETLARLLIYILAPIIVFYGTLTIPITTGAIALPFIFFILSTSIALLFLQIGTWIWKNDTTKNLLSLSAGTGNTGYFGIPVILAILGEKALGTAILVIVGFIVYENSIGIYIAARGNYSERDSIQKLLTIPTLYAFFAGLLCHMLPFDLAGQLTALIEPVKGTYTVLGMMMIGMALAEITFSTIDVTFVSLAFIAKFVVWPLAVGLVLAVDTALLHCFTPLQQQVCLLLSIVPLAANIISMSTEMNTHPQKAAIAVFLSTLFALFYIPVMISIWIY